MFGTEKPRTAQKSFNSLSKTDIRGCNIQISSTLNDASMQFFAVRKKIMSTYKT